MPTLPVPPLAQTLERYLETVRPLLDDAEFAATSAVVAEFAEGDGRACQAELERAARDAAETGGSWLTRPWLETYLATRDPMPLVSSVGFEITLPSPGAGPARAADAIHRLAAVHLAHLRGDLEPEIDPRGNAIDATQLAVLGGGLRRPGIEIDVLEPPEPSPARREILVLHRGRGFAVPVSDEAGLPLSVPTLQAALEELVDRPGHQELPFAASTYLPRAEAAEVEAELRAGPAGAATDTRVARTLFAVSLADDAADRADHLWDTTFGPAQVWTDKPLTYRIGLADDFLGAHFEHSGADGGTLQYIVGRAQRVDPDTSGPRPGVGPELLDGSLTPALTERVAAGLDAYRARARELRTRIHRVPAVPADRLPIKVSRDALLQFAFLYAQIRATGRVGSTYESVDMRAYAGGRTETLRPVTGEAVALVRGLLDGGAGATELRAALDAHRERVIRCKTGQAIDRHLYGLRLAAERLDLEPAIFADEGYRRLTTDVLSTTSLGNTTTIVRVAFAPTSEGGYGLYYVSTHDEDEVVVNHLAAQDDDIEAFLAGLDEGAARLWELAATTE